MAKHRGVASLVRHRRICYKRKPRGGDTTCSASGMAVNGPLSGSSSTGVGGRKTFLGCQHRPQSKDYGGGASPGAGNAQLGNSGAVHARRAGAWHDLNLSVLFRVLVSDWQVSIPLLVRSCYAFLLFCSW